MQLSMNKKVQNDPIKGEIEGKLKLMQSLMRECVRNGTSKCTPHAVIEDALDSGGLNVEVEQAP